MKKILVILFSSLIMFSCGDKNGEVKKESIKKDAIKEDKLVTIEEVFKENSKAKEHLNSLMSKEYDEAHDRTEIISDDFNNEQKIFPISEKKTDKVKIEIFESKIKKEDVAKLNVYYVRGNISFSCVSNDGYFSFNKIIILTDNNRYEINEDVLSQDLEHEGKYTIQTSKFVIDQEKYDMIADMAYSEKVRIRFSKNDNNKDFELTKEEKERIRDMYIMFDGAILFRETINYYIEEYYKK